MHFCFCLLFCLLVMLTRVALLKTLKARKTLKAKKVTNILELYIHFEHKSRSLFDICEVKGEVKGKTLACLQLHAMRDHTAAALGSRLYSLQAG